LIGSRLLVSRAAPIAVLGPERDRALGALARALVEHVTVVERRTVQVQADGRLRVAAVLDTVQANRIVDIGDVILLDDRRANLDETVPILGILLLVHIVHIRRPRELRLVQLAVQHFHETVGVGVVVNAAALTLVPAQEQEVVLAVALIDEISRVLVSIKDGKALPIGRIALVRSHQRTHIVHVDVVVGEDAAQLVDQLRQRVHRGQGTVAPSHRTWLLLRCHDHLVLHGQLLLLLLLAVHEGPQLGLVLVTALRLWPSSVRRTVLNHLHLDLQIEKNDQESVDKNSGFCSSPFIRVKRWVVVYFDKA